MAAVVTRSVRLGRPLAGVAVPDVDVVGPGVVLVTSRDGTAGSAFIDLCGGSLRPRSGSIEVLGVAPDDPRIARSRSVCRATTALAPSASVRQHISLFAHAAGTDERAFVDRLAAFGPTAWLEAPASRLASGLARLAWVVLTTTPRRRLVLLDDPFRGLDVDAATVLRAELDEWARRSTVVVADRTGDARWDHLADTVEMGSSEGGADPAPPSASIAPERPCSGRAR